MLQASLQQRLNKELHSLIRRSRLDKKLSVLPEEQTYAELFSNKLLLILLIREGISYSFFNAIREATPFTENDWAGYLDISTKSLQRYKQTSRQFKPLHSEKILEMAEVTSVGMEVFGDREKFKLWLDTPNYALGKLRPADLLKDSYGKELVLGELTRINHGILA